MSSSQHVLPTKHGSHSSRHGGHHKKRLAFLSRSTMGSGLTRNRSAFMMKSRLKTQDKPPEAFEPEVEVLSEHEEEALRKSIAAQEVEIKHDELAEYIAHKRAMGMMGIIDNLMDELYILLETAKVQRVHIDLDYKTPKERFDTGEADETIYDQKTLQLHDAAYYTEEEYRKVQRDCSWLACIFDTITKNTSLGDIVEEFRKILAVYDRTTQDETEILADLEKNRQRLNYYKNCIITEKQSMSKMIKEYTQTIGELKDEMEDLMLENKIRWRYINDWEDNRVETNQWINDHKEKSYKKTSKSCTHEMQKEMRIHDEILQFISMDETEMKVQIEKWMDTYDKAEEEKDTSIDALRLTKEDQSQNLEKLKKEYERRKEAINEYLAHKEVLREQALELKKKSIAATKIQSWWRGTMFRKGLGPYRKKKPKRGKSGKDKGKGKKK